MCTKRRLLLKALSLTATKIGRHGYSLYIDTHVYKTVTSEPIHAVSKWRLSLKNLSLTATKMVTPWLLTVYWYPCTHILYGDIRHPTNLSKSDIMNRLRLLHVHMQQKKALTYCNKDRSPWLLTVYWYPCMEIPHVVWRLPMDITHIWRLLIYGDTRHPTNLSKSDIMNRLM